MLRDNFVNEALFAALGVMQDCCDFSDLQHERMEKVRNSLGSGHGRHRGDKNGCCGGAHPTVFGAIGRLRPVVGLRGVDADKSLFPLPVIYVAWRVRDKIFPSLEVVEVPLGAQADKMISERQVTETAASGVRFVRCLHEFSTEILFSQTKTPSPYVLNAELLTDARKSILIDVLDKNPLFPFVYFSSFDWSQLNDPFLDLMQASSKESFATLKWEHHQDRVIFLPEQKVNSLLRMKSYAVERRTLSLF